MINLYDNLFSNNKENIKESLKKIKELSKLTDKTKINQFIEIVLKNYDKNNINNVKVTVRSLNKCVYKGIKIKFIRKYGDILLENIVNKSGYTRMIVFSVMNNFRLHLFFNETDKFLYSVLKSNELIDFYIDFYVNLTKLYEQNKDKKIKASILSCIKTFHSVAFNELISRTDYGKIYQKFRHILFNKRW